MRIGLAVAVAVLLPGCAKLNPAFEDAGEGSGAGTSVGTGGTAPTDTAATLPTASASGVTGSSTLPTTTELGSGDGSASDSGVTRGDWWDPDYRHRVQLVFHARSERLLGFVTYVDLNLNTSQLEGVSRSQLAFVDADSDTRIPAEITIFDTEEGDVAAWVQLPTWKSDEPTSVFLYFGFSAPDAPSVSPWVRHVAVWHMDEFTDGGVTPDAAGSADAMQAAPASPSLNQVPGVIGGALEFDGDAQRMEAVLSPVPLDHTFLVSGWVNAASYTNQAAPIIARGNLIGPSWVHTEWSMSVSADRAEVRLHDDGSDDSPTPNAGSSPVPPAASWHHYAFLYTGSWIRLYVDGVLRSSTSTAADAEHILEIVSIAGYLGPVRKGGATRLLEGRVDELRWRLGANDDGPNDAWVATLFQSQQTPGSTYTPAPVEDF